MSSQIGTILLIGSTSGIGEALTRRFHDMGKKVIVTGRDRAKLAALAAELNSLETRHVSGKLRYLVEQNATDVSHANAFRFLIARLSRYSLTSSHRDANPQGLSHS